MNITTEEKKKKFLPSMAKAKVTRVHQRLRLPFSLNESTD